MKIVYEYQLFVLVDETNVLHCGRGSILWETHYNEFYNWRVSRDFRPLFIGNPHHLGLLINRLKQFVIGLDFVEILLPLKLENLAFYGVQDTAESEV